MEKKAGEEDEEERCVSHLARELPHHHAMLIGTCLSVRIMALNLNILPIKMNYACDMFFQPKSARGEKRRSRRKIDKAKFYYTEERFPSKKRNE